MAAFEAGCNSSISGLDPSPANMRRHHPHACQFNAATGILNFAAKARIGNSPLDGACSTWANLSRI
jgi:hypothetical protein